MNVHHIDQENYRRATEWAKQADTRASVILAFNAALVALLLNDNAYTFYFFTAWREGRVDMLHDTGTFFFCGFLLAFTISTLCALWVLMKDARKTRCEHNSVFSFMNITDMTREQYRDALFNVNETKTLHAWEDQTYLASVLARQKLKWMHRGWVFLAGAIFCIVAFMIISVIIFSFQ